MSLPVPSNLLNGKKAACSIALPLTVDLRRAESRFRRAFSESR